MVREGSDLGLYDYQPIGMNQERPWIRWRNVSWHLGSYNKASKQLHGAQTCLNSWQPVKTPPFHGNRIFITVFTRACHGAYP